jgi:hypothetical protein
MFIPLTFKHTFELIDELGNMFVPANDQERVVYRQMILTSFPLFRGGNRIRNICNNTQLL